MPKSEQKLKARSESLSEKLKTLSDDELDMIAGGSGLVDVFLPELSNEDPDFTLDAEEPRASSRCANKASPNC